MKDNILAIAGLTWIFIATLTLFIGFMLVLGVAVLLDS